jgi:hypothetical protein
MYAICTAQACPARSEQETAEKPQVEVEMVIADHPKFRRWKKAYDEKLTYDEFFTAVSANCTNENPLYRAAQEARDAAHAKYDEICRDLD